MASSEITVDAIAKEVARNSLLCSFNRIFIVGPLVNIKERKGSLFLAPQSGRVFYVNSNKQSFILSGLDDVTIRITGNSNGTPGKVNHILIRECNNTRIQIDGGVISGITILKGKRVIVDLPVQNTTAIEQTSDSIIRGRITPDSVIYVTASQEITINHEILPINPFMQGLFINGFFIPMHYTAPGLQILEEVGEDIISYSLEK